MHFTSKGNLIIVIWHIILITSCVYGITIDGQLTVIKNDCYERLAIGEKLSPKQIYKTFDHNTVLRCEKECTEEKETCRAFSFGIAPKGNATCLLSKNPIKETADFKPIGTISDTDYDLYIKKLDCQIVHEPPQFHGPSDNTQNYGTKPLLYSGEVHHGQIGYSEQENHNEQEKYYGAHGNLPAHSGYFNSVSKPNNNVPNNGYQYDKPINPFLPEEPPRKKPMEDNLHHVETLVSIASGPQNILHPIHDILVSGGMDYGQEVSSSHQHNGGGAYGNYNDDIPPFRPPGLNNPYDDHIPPILPLRPLSEDNESPSRPQSEYGNFNPELPRPGYGSVNPITNNRPSAHYLNDYRPGKPPYGYESDKDRPDPDYGSRPPMLSEAGYGSGGQLTINRRKYESSNQFNSFQSETIGYGPDRPPHPSSYNFYDHYNKPNANRPNRYGSVIPHPNEYDRPDPHYDYLLLRPNYEPYDNGRPPLRPLRPEYDNRKPAGVGGNADPGYGGSDRPPGGSYGSNLDYGIKRPLNAEDEYGKPSRPTSDQRRPTHYDQPNSTRPSKTPVDSSTVTSRPPSTELSNHYGGIDYNNKQYGKPGESLNDKGDGGNRKIVSQSTGYHGEQITSIITELKYHELDVIVIGCGIIGAMVK